MLPGAGCSARVLCLLFALHLLGRRHMIGQLQHAALPQNALPQLHADNAEDEEHEEAQQQNVAQHGQRVQQQHDQNAHAWTDGRDGQSIRCAAACVSLTKALPPSTHSVSD